MNPPGEALWMYLGQIANNIAVKDDLRAEVTEALIPVYANLDSINATSERALGETKVSNERLTAIEQKTSSEVFFLFFLFLQKAIRKQLPYRWGETHEYRLVHKGAVLPQRH